MKKIIILCSALFATAAIAHTIDWHVDGQIYQTTSCESGDNITPPTPPAKYGYTFREWQGYKQIEYIESTGTQCIDTGIESGLDIQIQAEFEATENTFTRYGVVVGAGANYQALVSRLEPNTYYASLYNSTSGYTSSGVIASDKFEFTFNNRQHQLIIGDTSYDLPITPNFVAKQIALFGLSNHYAPNFGIGRLYYVKIKNTSTDTLLRDFIPVIDHNGVACMYDRVSRTFFYNNGTGDFIPGPIVR